MLNHAESWTISRLLQSVKRPYANASRRVPAASGEAKVCHVRDANVSHVFPCLAGSEVAVWLGTDA